MKPTVHAFDFDGTLTRRDTFLLFLRHLAGTPRFLLGMAQSLPVIAGMAFGVVPTQRAKEAVFARFCRGIPLAVFNERCRSFAKDALPSTVRLFRPTAMDAVREAARTGRVLIVSASVENYIAPFFDGLDVDIEATRAEVDGGGRLTGRFLGTNCKGAEKVRRILVRYPRRAEYRLVAYGDSAGDREMLSFADEAHFKPFRAARGRTAAGEVARFVLVGGMAVAVQYATYRALLRACGPTAAYAAAYLVSLVVNFILSSCFTFRVRPTVCRAFGFLLSHAVNFGAQVALLRLLIRLGISARLAPLPVYAVCMPLNFLLVRLALRGWGRSGRQPRGTVSPRGASPRAPGSLS